VTTLRAYATFTEAVRGAQVAAALAEFDDMDGDVSVSAPGPAAAPVTRVGRNTAFRVAAQAMSAAINVVGMVLLGNHLSTAGYGQYAFYYALIPLLSSFADLGTGTILTRQVARSPEAANRCLGDAILIRGAVALVLVTVVGVFAGRALDPASALLLGIVTAAAVLDFGQDVSVWMFRAHERLDLEAVLLLVSQSAWILGIALGVALGATLPILLGTAVGAFLIRTVVGASLVSHLGLKPDFSPALARLRQWVREGWPVAVSLLVVVLYGRVGVFTLKAFASDAEVACFNVAYMLSQPFGFLGSSLAMAAFPAFARLSGGGAPDLARPLRATFKYQLLVSLPLAAALVALADRIVPLLFHDAAAFARASQALGIIALALPFVFLNLQSRYLLAAIGRQKVYLWAVATGLVLNAFGCTFTASRLGVIGAAWTFVAAELAVFLVCHSALASQVSHRRLLSKASRPAFAAAVMALVVWGLHTLPLAVAVAAGAATYVAALWLTRALSRAEWDVVRSVLRSLAGARRRLERRPS
jgi:O-antigen/teichoic acid export membrane protein